MPLQHVYRPTNFNEFAGNDSTIESLMAVLERKKDIPHSYLFTGPSGCGKTTLAHILKKELGISDMDFYVYNASNTRGIDTIRQIQEMAQFSSLNGNRKMYLLDETHQVTGAAQEALLLLLENPPPHVFIALCTTEPDKLKPTIKRRCHQAEVKRLEEKDITAFLLSILELEKIKDYSGKVIERIAETSDGSPGLALSLLDSVIELDEDMAMKAIESVTINEKSVIDLCRALLDTKNTQSAKWTKIKKILNGIDGEPESIRHAVLGYFTKVMLSDNGNDLAADILSLFTESFIYSGRAGLVLACYLSCKA
jgi:DNA polymerase-3 subunit gamma/tau